MGAHAYDAIRSSNDVSVIAGNLKSAPRLAGGAGFSREEIQTIKNHVFYERHPLEGDDGGTV